MMDLSQKYRYTIVQTLWLFTLITPVLVLISGVLWIQENTLSTVFWNNHPPVINWLHSIRVLTVMEIISFSFVICLFFFIVKEVVRWWRPDPMINNISIQFAYIYGIMFFFIFNQVNDFKYVQEGFHQFRIFDLIKPFCLTLILFLISVLGFYIAELKNKRKRRI